MTKFEVFEHAKLLGCPATLLQWDEKTKGGNKVWQNIKPEKWRTMDWDGHYNVGVRTGYDAGGLFDIEFDTQAAEDYWLERNPWAKTTHQTKGERGTHYWLRLVGAPDVTKNMYLNGVRSGEYRAGGVTKAGKVKAIQSIVAGVHPAGMNYTHNGLPVLTVPWETVSWGDITFISEKQQEKLDKAIKAAPLAKPEQISVPNEPDEAIEVPVLEPTGMGALVDDAIRAHIPYEKNTNHKNLFALAASLTRMRAAGVTVDMDKVFAAWAGVSEVNFRVGSTIEDYKDEFTDALAAVDSSRDPLALATEAAKSSTQAWDGVTDLRKQALLRVCWELSKQGAVEFYISTRAAAAIVGSDYVTMSRWFGHFRKLKILELTKANTKYKAARYKFSSAVTPTK